MEFNLDILNGLGLTWLQKRLFLYVILHYNSWKHSKWGPLDLKEMLLSKVHFIIRNLEHTDKTFEMFLSVTGLETFQKVALWDTGHTQSGCRVTGVLWQQLSGPQSPAPLQFQWRWGSNDSDSADSNCPYLFGWWQRSEGMRILQRQYGLRILQQQPGSGLWSPSLSSGE